jgi:predicted DNA-binding ribbon-helix-helix protein
LGIFTLFEGNRRRSGTTESNIHDKRREVVTLKKRIYIRSVSVTLSESMFKQIYEIAEKEEISMSEIIREAIQEKLSIAVTTDQCNK